VLTLIIGILIIVVLGAILFWVIDKFCPDARLAQLLKLLGGVDEFAIEDRLGIPRRHQA
jgi:hypothetical protein